MDLMVLEVQGDKNWERADFYDESASGICGLAMRDPGDATRACRSSVKYDRLAAFAINCVSPALILQASSTSAREGPVQQAGHYVNQELEHLPTSNPYPDRSCSNSAPGEG